jgi:hypothetical protein
LGTWHDGGGGAAAALQPPTLPFPASLFTEFL